MARPICLTHLLIPVMDIAGSRDSVSGSPIPLAEAIPHARAVLVPNKSHLSVINSEFFYGAVLGFLGHVWQDDPRHSWIDCQGSCGASAMFLSQVIFVAMMIHTQIGISAEPWRSVNDGVMGGISFGTMVRVDDMLRFEGELSLENNGGFASVRRLVDLELSMAKSVRLRLRGDGREYQFRLRTNDRLDGIAWRAKCLTTGDWQTINLEFGEFEPVFRGRLVADAGPLNPGEIHQIGLMLADKQAGPFRLDIKSIQFHQAEQDHAISKRNRSKSDHA